ncbi:pyridoxamine 5'-phosphate oxidase family protein [Corallococcus exiguus]|uniref:pyridoxamine 5'-phosphate oxidase family protein n=1 Tax=Corallococcus TaxID=83461 RepID=UPI000EBBA6E2|nr:MULTISPECIES: pyridoxamine 5'-phosphate oxidase family protein [Corallococcus]NNB91109.1 pyridoxamine 5'-phosphate oxidase family protein [Corallococcus exiguus]NNB98666.1 pyridoxamine 5'-phosphate oxidase family protein [Corallococcus exiguus]NNC07432.1 pyridoxamine 5'-phosphate oxidase family protein [Corallococcus exiguus]NPC51421.1 pyridoxamine 5'-phosphate oxidase family protein [Corallococcus exiguus]RKH80999.1 pyridoxamine 5'-phosphate oxidase family protein [Corallococcus sp. AB032C
METVKDLETLERLYGVPGKSSVLKEVDHVHPAYRPFIERSPFMALATSGPEGLDVSPRGDPAGFVVIEDAHTLLLPDRRGNNRCDSLRNILADPRVALLFFVPGVNETLRVNGRASIVIEPSLLERFTFEGKLPRSVLRITVETVYFQCSRALIRSGLWDPARQVTRAEFPSPGAILEALSPENFDGGEYDRELPGRLKTSLY